MIGPGRRMLENQDIICIAPTPWKVHARLNAHHVMGRLASANRVLFVESLGLRAPAGHRGDWEKVVSRIAGSVRGLRGTPEGVWLISPLILPFHGSRAARRLNARWLAVVLRRAARRLHMDRPILWIFLPTGADLVGRLNEKLVVYHCVDAYAENPGVDAASILALERKLLASCDLFFATSRALFDEKHPARGRKHYVPNVGDVNLFERGGAAPDDLRSIPAPRIGYIGNLAAYKVDIALLASVAAAREEWSFCFVGPHAAGDPGTDLSPLAGLPNVHLLGPRAHTELPSYVHAFDVCVIPFHLNPSTRASFPLKFFEYMAAGKEIVSTPLESLSDYRSRPDLCRFAETADGFVRSLEEALHRPQTAELIGIRRAEAREHSWERRMEEISGAVEEVLRGPERGPSERSAQEGPQS